MSLSAVKRLTDNKQIDMEIIVNNKVCILGKKQEYRSNASDYFKKLKCFAFALNYPIHKLNQNTSNLN